MEDDLLNVNILMVAAESVVSVALPVQPKRSDKSALGPHADLFTDIGPI